MIKIYEDNTYIDIVCHILNDSSYQKIKDYDHHGTNRLNHSIKVSYYSYKITKFLKLNYKNTAIGGLLHDFFYSKEKTKKSKVDSTFKHPKIALKNANNKFTINELEEDIILSHMFPIVINYIPKYAESWIVSIVDKFIGILEFLKKYKYTCKIKIRNAFLLMTIFLTRLI